MADHPSNDLESLVAVLIREVPGLGATMPTSRGKRGPSAAIFRIGGSSSEVLVEGYGPYTVETKRNTTSQSIRLVNTIAEVKALVLLGIR
jgi:hypothetical protein